MLCAQILDIKMVFFMLVSDLLKDFKTEEGIFTFHVEIFSTFMDHRQVKKTQKIET